MHTIPESRRQTHYWDYGFLGLIGLVASVFLAGEGWPKWTIVGWLCVTFLAAWGFGWSVMSLVDLLRNQREDQWNKASEIWLWLVAGGAAMALACWKLGDLPFYLLPALMLSAAAIALLSQSGAISGIIWGLGAAILVFLGWASVRQSLFQVEDGPVWFLVGFLIFWFIGCELFEKGLGIKEKEKQTNNRLAWDLARIFHLLSLAPLFFLGQMKEMGFVYGISVFLILIFAESKFRGKKSESDLAGRMSGTNNWVGVMVLLACLFGRLV